MTVLARHDNGAIAAVLPDGKRRHFQHGPIDLVVEAFGPERAVADAYARAWQTFPGTLPSLVAELAALRTPVSAGPQVSGPVASAMVAACQPFAARFVTPMAAVAGAVADHVLAAMTAAGGLDRAYVNNGGDIALWLAEGETLTTGIVPDQDAPALDAFGSIGAASPVRGIATSGWKGRSHSLGIADSVTVLARTAAAADVAATLIANAVDADDPAVARKPARDLDADSDLGDRPVTVDVGALSPDSVASALDAGLAEAERWCAAGAIESALIWLQQESRATGAAPALLAAE